MSSTLISKFKVIIEFCIENPSHLHNILDLLENLRPETWETLFEFFNYTSKAEMENLLKMFHIFTVISGDSIRYQNMLSQREQEIFLSLGCGKSNKEISESYGVTLNTVNKHRENIRKKLKLKNFELINAAVKFRSAIEATHSSILETKEKEIAVLLLKGLTNKEISKNLRIPETYLISYYESMQKKMKGFDFAGFISVCHGYLKKTEVVPA